MDMSKVGQRCCLFRVYDDEHRGNPTVITGGLMEEVNVNINKNWQFTISELSEQILKCFMLSNL